MDQSNKASATLCEDSYPIRMRLRLSTSGYRCDVNIKRPLQCTAILNRRRGLQNLTPT